MESGQTTLARVKADAREWKRNAKCRYGTGEGYGPSVMYAENGVGADRAKKICWGTMDGLECPVRAKCLELGVITNDIFGVFGGHGQRERVKVRKIWLATGVVKDLPAVAVKLRRRPSRAA